MNYSNDHTLMVFVEESTERIDAMESGLLAMEQAGEVKDRDIDSVFRDAHSMKAGANLLKLTNIETLAHKMENIFEMIRQRQIDLDSTLVTALLSCVDKLRELMDNIDTSDKISIRLHVAMLNVALNRAMQTDDSTD